MIEEANRNHMNEEIDKENSGIQGAVKVCGCLRSCALATRALLCRFASLLLAPSVMLSLFFSHA